MWHGLVYYDYEDQKKRLKQSFNKELFGVENFGNIWTWNEVSKLAEKEYSMFITHMTIICELYSMFFKRKCFSDEKEYRIVFSQINNQQSTYFRNKRGVVTPYIIKKTNNLDYINSIMIGPTSKEDKAYNGIRELLKYNNCQATVKKSSLPLRY